MVPKVDLEKFYTDATDAIAKKEYDTASNLLKQILAQNENYKDVSRLLAQIIQLKRHKWYNDVRVWGSLSTLVVVLLAIWGIPRLLPLLRQTQTETQILSDTSSLYPSPSPYMTQIVLTPTTETTTSEPLA